jgi:hypothetical protein
MKIVLVCLAMVGCGAASSQTYLPKNVICHNDWQCPDNYYCAKSDLEEFPSCHPK